MKINTNFINNTGIKNLASPFSPVRSTDNLANYVFNLFNILNQYNKDIKKEVAISMSGDTADVNVVMSKI